MNSYRFEQIAINCKEKRKPTEADMTTYIGLEHLDSGSLKIRRWGSSVPIKGEKLVMRKGDVLLGKRNAYLKRAAIAPHDGLFSAHGMVLNPHEDVVNKGFFPHFILSDYFFDEAIKISVGSLSPTINWRDIAKVEFRLPDLEKQQELANTLWAITDVIDGYKDLLEKTDELVKAQFIEMFGLPEENVHGFEVGHISDVVTDVHYGTAKKASDDGDYTYIRMNNITYEGTLDLADVKRISVPEKELDGCLVKKGDILFNRTNSRDLVGKTCAFNLDEPMIIAGYIIRLRMNGRVHPEYLSTFMNLPRSKALLMSMAKGAVGQANINAQEVQSIELVIPPEELQVEFDHLIRQRDKSKFEISQALDSATALYKKILAEAFEDNN